MTSELDLAAADRRRGTIALEPTACTSCMICVRECPVWCIELSAHEEGDTGTTARRGRMKYVLDSFVIDFSLCMECGICVDVCPTDALSWQPTGTPSGGARGLLAVDRADVQNGPDLG